MAGSRQCWSRFVSLIPDGCFAFHVTGHRFPSSLPRPELHGFGHSYADAQPDADAFADSDTFSYAERIPHAEPHSEQHRDAIIDADREPDGNSKRDVHSQWHTDALPDSEPVAHADTDCEWYADPDINAVVQPGASAKHACGVVSVAGEVRCSTQFGLLKLGPSSNVSVCLSDR